MYLKLSNQIFGCRGGEDNSPSSGGNKAFINGLIKERQQGIIVSVNIQQANLHKLCIID